MVLPKNFLWGGSVSAHQTEGANSQDYGKGPSIYDYLEQKGFGDFSGGIDTYHRFTEDIALFKELGINSYRFSIAWSRILPQGEGTVNEQGLAYYDAFIDALIAADIEPIICLYHFDTPLALQEKYQGWLGRETINAFIEYTRVVMKRYGDRVKYWIPMNEQNGCPLVGLLSLGIGPDHEKFDVIRNQLAHNIAVASAHVHRLAKELVEDSKVISMVVASPAYPKTCNPKDVLVAQDINESFNHSVLSLLVNGEYARGQYRKMEKDNTLPVILEEDMTLLQEQRIDRIGLSYYASITASEENAGIDPSRNTLRTFQGLSSGYAKNEFLGKTEWDWTIDHDGLRVILKDVYNRYNLPIYVLESGIGVIEELDENYTVQDDYRIEYFKNQIQSVKDAVDIDGVDVRSFLTWAPIDILSSQGEMKKRYGFIYVNRNETDMLDLKRYKKKSFAWFNQVIKSNGREL